MRESILFPNELLKSSVSLTPRVDILTASLLIGRAERAQPSSRRSPRGGRMPFFRPIPRARLPSQSAGNRIPARKPAMITFAIPRPIRLVGRSFALDERLKNGGVLRAESRGPIRVWLLALDSPPSAPGKTPVVSLTGRGGPSCRRGEL
jgi:hypothetical protein